MKRFFKILLLTLLFLFGLAYILLQSNPVQNYIIKRVTSSMEKKSGTKVRIGHVDIDFFHGVRFDDVLICDLHEDTVIYSRVVKLDLKDVKLNSNQVLINFVLLENANIKLKRHAQDKRWAYMMLLDNFKSKNTNKKSNSPNWDIEIAEIKLDDCAFQYEDEHANHRVNEFDEDHIQFTHLNAKIEEMSILGDSTRLRIKQFNAIEQCGFVITNLQSLLSINAHEMNFSELHIITPYSDIKNQFIMRYDSIDDFDDFLSKVRLEAHIDQSTIGFDDLHFFASELEGMHQKIILSGVGKGPVDNLKCKNITAKFGNESYFNGNMSFKGLPDVYETFFDISTKDARLTKADLEYLIGQELPQEVYQLGSIKYQMKAIGFMRDFVLEGDFATASGNLRTDLNLKFPEDKIESYSGTASFKDFNLGKLTGNKNIEEVSGRVSVDGSGLTLKTISTKIDADLESILFNQYNYKNITAHGTIANKLFTGKALVADENLNLDFDGTVDYSKGESIFNFNAKIKNANLKALNLDSANSILNAQVQMNLHGNNIANIYGNAVIPMISYQRDGRKYEFKKLELSSKILSGKRSIDITSDVIDASIDGNYNFNDLADAITNEAANLYPDYFKHIDKVSIQDFVYHFNLKKPEEFISLLDPDLNLKPTIIEGYFNNGLHSYAVHIKSQQITYGAIILDSIVLDATRKVQEPLQIGLRTFGIHEESIAPYITHDSVSVTCDYNTMKLKVDAFDKNTGNKVNLFCSMDFMKEGIALKMINSGGKYQSIPFEFTHLEPIFLSDGGARFINLMVKSQDQEVAVNGRLSKHPDEQITLGIHSFQLSTINNLMKNIGVNLYGEVNGNLSITNPLNKPYFSSDSSGITVKTFRVDNDTFGNLRINSTYSKSDNLIFSKVQFTDGDLQNLVMEGKVYANRKSNYLDFDIDIGETPTRVLNFVFKGIASQLEGSLTGKAKLTGSFDKPEFNGSAFLKNGGFTVDYLRTHYKFDNEILIKKNSFEFYNAKLYDENKRLALANGKVTHSNFDHWAIDIIVGNFSNYKILNTSARDNDLFYGIGYATGNVSMKGDIDNIKMVMNLKSNKGTIINIPLTNPEYSSKSSYITFKEKNPKASKSYQVLLSGLELDMNLDINEDAYIKLIFDSQLGDIIEGTGTGNMRMNISPTGDFTMFGYYEIVHGKYLFTKYDIFNKPFIVKKGGRITWDGDPYAAKVNLEAVYNISQANANSLLPEQTGSSASAVTTIPVDCILYLKGLLFKPDITFNIEIPKLQNFNNPTLENTVKTYITSWQQNPDELNKQVFSLLFFKRFFPLDNGTQAFTPSAGGYTALGDLLTAQLTNWLGQVFTNNPLGIDYNKTDTKGAGIWIFKLSKKFFNDRLVLEGNYVLDGEATSNVTGNISAQVLLDRSGQLRFTVFSKKANNTFTYNQNVLTSGAGFYWRTEFNTFKRRKRVPTQQTNNAPIE